MVVNYEDWDEQDVKRNHEQIRKALDELSRGRIVSPLFLCPELGITSEDRFTLWHPPGSPDDLTTYPQTNLANLAMHYNKILVPISVYQSKQDFEHCYAMRLEDLVEQLKANRDKYVPVLAARPNNYRSQGFYDEVFESCRQVYGQYPPFPTLRVQFLQDLSAKSVAATQHNITKSGAWLDEVSRRCPELDLDYVEHTEVGDLIVGDRRGLENLARDWRVDPVVVKKHMATCLLSLRTFGHGNLVKFLLDLQKANQDLYVFYELVRNYRDYLVGPVEAELGGFGNYTTWDLERMVFLRVLPLKRQDIARLTQENRQRLYLNCPGARSPVTLEGYRMNVFLGDGNDAATLNKIWEISESYKNQTKILAEYRSYIASRRLPDAQKAFEKAGKVFGQISQEIEAWRGAERGTRLAVYSISGGAMILSNLALILGGLPTEWKLVITLFKDIMAFLGIKELDPKKLVDLIYGVKNWPWYEKGVPYLYWKQEKNP